MLLGVFVFLQIVRGTLTDNGIVTASSVNLISGNGLDGVKDGIFSTTYFSGKKCLITDNDPTRNEWFNIQMEFTSVVETVIIVNKESCCTDRIKTTDLYVGFDPIPNNNIACLADPQ